MVDGGWGRAGFCLSIGYGLEFAIVHELAYREFVVLFILPGRSLPFSEHQCLPHASKMNFKQGA